MAEHRGLTEHGVTNGVQLDSVSKRYDDNNAAAVDSISLAIAPGEFVTLLGPSGCGKTTTLHLIAGLERPTSGRVMINGKDVTELPPQLRDIALVFQDYALYPHMTVSENIAFPLRLRRRKIARPEVRRRVYDVIGKTGLTGLGDRLPAELSGGQRQRVALARAVVRTPEAFLFDEPLSNLDSRLRVSMRAELKELHRRLGSTMIYVTHDQAEAMVLSDRVAVLRDGKIEQFDTPLELYKRPSTAFVASFIGEFGTNLLEGGEISKDDGSAVYKWHEWRIRLPDAPLDTGKDASLSIRPEYIEVCDPDTSELRGLLTAVEPYGDRTRVRVEVGGQEIIAAAAESLMERPGAVVGLAVSRRDRLVLFDRNTGSRLLYRTHEAA